MSQQTVEAPPIRVPDAAPEEAPKLRSSATQLIVRYPWVVGAVVLLAISTALVLYMRTRPGYDPYGWLVWGKLTIHWKLDTNGAPSWKPLPFLFTVPYALVGHYALWLWMITSVAISLSGVVFAWRIAFRLTDAAPEHRYAAYAAGAFAALALLGIRDYTHFIFSAQSDTMIVSLCLAAIDCQLSGRPRWALWMWALAGLGRPEVWPFLAIYAFWTWRSIPEMRRMIVAALVVQPLLWFGIPALTSNSWFVAGNNALHSPRELHGSKVWGTIDRFLDLHEAPVWIAALLATALAVLRRQKIVLILAAGSIAWVVIEVAFVLHGWPGVPRYLFEPVGVVAVIAGVFVGRLILDVPPLIARFAPRLSPQLAGWATGLLVLALVGSLAPAARSRLRIERKDLTHERARAREFGRLSVVVGRLGASRILACGQPNIPIGYQSVFAWYTGVKIGILYVNPNYLRLHPHPLVNFYPLGNGWKVAPSRVTAATAARCHGLRLTYRS